MAVGFSLDDKMGEDAVVVCKKDKGKNSDEVKIRMGNNFVDGMDPEKERGTDVQRKHNEVTEIGKSHEDGTISCEFTLPFTYKTESGMRIDFMRIRYFIFLAVGNDASEPGGPGPFFLLRSKKPCNFL